MIQVAVKSCKFAKTLINKIFLMKNEHPHSQDTAIPHDPTSFVTGLSAKLATRSRHVCAFLGAGISGTCGLPNLEELQDYVLENLGNSEKQVVGRLLKKYNLEGVLSRLRRISALISGEEKVDGLTAERARELDVDVCRLIVEALSVDSNETSPIDYLAAWAGRTNYHRPLELFTVNYDLLLETALEKKRVPYFDGFVGALEARFHTELAESLPKSDAESVPAFFVRLWKLHGSVNWAWTNDQQIVRLGQPVSKDLAAAIYPSDAKYEESRRIPFVVLQDLLRRALHQHETLMLISGYSFADDHLNEHLFSAAMRRPRSEFVAFCFSQIPEVLANHATDTPNFQVVSRREAIIGSIRANWEPKKDTPANIWDRKSNQFALCDFRNLAKYLARSTAREYEVSSDPENIP